MRMLLPLTLMLVGCAASTSEVDEPGSTEDGVHSAPAPEPPETCGLGWGQDPDSFSGVEGTYGRAGTTANGEMKTLTLSNVVRATAHISSEGDAALTLECGSTACTAENVRASLLPTNAAMNPMLMLSANGFSQPNPDLRGVFNVLGLERNASGEITKLCLFKLDPQQPSDPFIMKRR